MRSKIFIPALLDTVNKKEANSAGGILRSKIVIRGAVQGIGFRPFIYRLANELRLAGWVRNSSGGVFIEAEGTRRDLEDFTLRIEAEKPIQSFIQSFEAYYLDPLGYDGFEIRPSDNYGDKTALVMPDIAACPDCIGEIFDPANRRYLYPFTNCTNCGPRYSIIEALPYDRANTSMKKFQMCEKCLAEYENPLDRRFHAQPNACPECGPHLELWDSAGNILSTHHKALLAAADGIRNGKIAAVKGLGGFHLIVDAVNEKAVLRLRERKAREEKPFALMYPAMDMIESHCFVSPSEKRLLQSPECPIVLLKRKSSNNPELQPVAPSVAPNNPYLGIMLPYTPLHHILMRELGFPVIATSGNLKDEPICIDENDALQRLSGIADFFLMHNRPIVRHIDDSIVRVVLDRELVLRRARGYAPLPVNSKKQNRPVLAVGGHLKNTIAITDGKELFLSQHIGDLETAQAYSAFQNTIDSLSGLYDFSPEVIVCDRHPDYLSSKYARKSGLPVIEVQHHFAHILSCMAENELEGSVLGVSWDGTGYGLDGSIWGGEFLHTAGSGFERAAHLRTFPLPGGESAVKEPRRSALGLLFAIYGDDLFNREGLKPLEAFSSLELKNLRTMLTRKLNSPLTSSAGRLFDAVASIIGIRHINGFEGQAAMELEFLTDDTASTEYYPFDIKEGSPSVIVDWAPMIQLIVEDVERGISKREIAVRFHNTMVEMMTAIARRINENRIILTGGCFQNRYLTERAVNRLRSEGFQPYWHQRVPPNDGGIAVGQAYAASLVKN
ncbi:MAG: carbamoyltransferase HypF [candidate division Zixibacteria bacterium]|nr:carbamoyltransferase HypF [Candidatus Tariuqbacter arcticus]